jgi:spore germination protein YaaH/flagellar hook assembly protein FlgD
LTQRSNAYRLRRSIPTALLAAGLLAGTLPPPGAASTPARAAVPFAAASVPTASVPAASVPAVAAPGPAGPSADPVGPDPVAGTNTTNPIAPDPGQHPSAAYEDWLAHAGDRLTFRPGGRVTVPFTPRATDRWSVGGRAPVRLPAGLATGADMAASPQGSTWVASGAPRARPSRNPSFTPSAVPAMASSLTVGSGTGGITVDATSAAFAPAGADPAVTAASVAGLRRQVFGFLPYWELSGASTSLAFDTLSTIAYFSVGADRAGNLLKKTSSGGTTTGWGGWTSSSMTSVINAAHARGTRVVLTASVFAWTGSQATIQRALLGSSAARLNLARQLAAAVRDRGADGVNLDFEPLASGYETQFTAFVKTLRSQLNAIRPGYQVTFDTTGYVGNYPLAAAIGSTGADAVFIMGYDYRTSGSGTSGSIDPLSGPTYDLADTVRTYTSIVAPSRVILGVPWYGRAWSTTSSSPRSANQSGAKFGYSTAVNYENIPALVAKYGRRWDAVEQSPYIAYRRQNCTSTYGCVTSWRQVWYDDAASMALRLQLVNDYGLRGAGMWALGYDGAYPDLDRALANAFLVDHSAPQAGITLLPPAVGDEGFTVTWSAADVSAVASYDVQVSTDGGAWTPWLTRTRATGEVWLGVDGHAYGFRVRATDAKGNAGTWNVTVATATAGSIARGGFGRVTLNGLSYRTGPGTAAAQLGTLAAGTIVAFTSGPVASGGYTWWEVTQPIRQWSPVSFVERGVWIAVGNGSASYVVPYHAPNTTAVHAGIAGLDFASGGARGPAGANARTFSPNGDGARDALRLRWTNGLAMDAMTLNVYRADGSLAGTVPVSAVAAGARTWDWNGRIGSARLADGRYMLQLVGVAGAKTYRAPSANPVTPAQVALYAVTLDTVPPAIAAPAASSSVISPNGDGIHDTVAWSLSSPTASGWTMRITDAHGTLVRGASGTGRAAAFTWNGMDAAGARAADGRYTATLAACDIAGNCAPHAFAIIVDATAPRVTATATAAFSPNGDGTMDAAGLAWASTEAASGTAGIWRGTTLVRSWTVTRAAAGAVTWNGRTAAGAAVADGRYAFRVDVRDAAGNRTVTNAAVVVDRTAGYLRWRGSFFPQDGDRLAATAVVSFTLTRTATTALGIYDAKGTLVRTAWTKRTFAAGSHTWTWDGRLASGAWAPQGRYVARLITTSSLGTSTLVRTVLAAAYAARLSASTVKAGSTLVVTFSPVEPLSSRPTVTFTQPGRAGVTVTATKLADGTWRAAFKVRAGAAGAASVRITALDSAGHRNTLSLSLAVAS